MSFGLCHGIFVKRYVRTENGRQKSIEQIAKSIKCLARSMERHWKIADCHVKIVKRIEKGEKRYGNFVKQVMRK